MEGKFSVPSIKFEKLENPFDDSRYQRVKIWAINVGKNYNYSIFTKDAIEKSLSTLPNNPILGRINEDDTDFLEHEQKVKVVDGVKKYVYDGFAYGFVPENCNPKYEWQENGEGVLEEYLTFEAVLWTKFQTAIDIFENSNNVKKHSMELSDRYSGEWNEEGYFVFEKFEFDGFCILGDNFEQGIPNSNIELQFKKESVRNVFEKEVEEYYNLFKKYSRKENQMDFLNEILSKFGITQEDLELKVPNFSTLNEEELSKAVSENFTTEPQAEPATEPTEPVTEPTEPTEPQEPTVEPEEPVAEPTEPTEPVTEPDMYIRKFALSHNDVRTKIYKQLDNVDRSTFSGLVENQTINYMYSYILETYDNHFVAEVSLCTDDNYVEKTLKFGYSKSNNDVVIENGFEEVSKQYLTKDEANAVEILRSQLELFKNENAELSKFKENAEKEKQELEVKEVIEEFSDVLSKDDVAEVLENIEKYNKETAKNFCLQQVGLKSFSKLQKKKEPKSIALSVSHNENTLDDSGYGHLFNKHKN